MVLYGGGKLVCHLSRHKRVCNLLAFKIVVQCHQVQTKLLGDDIDGSTAGQCRIKIHHAGIETIAGVCGNTTVGSQGELALIPLAKGRDIVVLYLTTLGRARGARCV